MAELTVEVVKVESVAPHPNAERLELIKLVDNEYQIVSGISNYKSGDLAYYFPVDSVLPAERVEEFGIGTYYHNRIKATKLRGIFSEGLLIPVYKDREYIVGEDVTELFGVTKYVVPEKIGNNNKYATPIEQYRFPSPEHLKKYPHIFSNGEMVVITEKIHGTNCSIMKTIDGELKFASHNCFWEDVPENNCIYTKIYHQNTHLGLIPKNYQVFCEIYGSGVQDLTYGLSGIDYAAFGVSYNGVFLDYPDFQMFCSAYNIKTASLLYVGKYSYDVVQSFNNANSIICPTQMMEGVIVQPLVERFSEHFGRVCMKFISDKYLLRKHGTEFK